MNRIKRFFLSRTTTICLIASALSGVLLSTLIPQSFLSVSETMLEWRTSHPLLARLSELLGLHEIYTNPVFLLVLTGVTVSLFLSTCNQFVTAWRRTFHPQAETADGDCFTALLTAEECWRVLARSGYFRRRRTPAGMSLVRHPWGYWGNALLHAGMVVTIGASLFIALTQQQAVVQLAEGVTQRPHDPLLLEEHGMLGQPLILPDALRLDQVSYGFRPDYSIRELTSTLSFLSGSDTIDTKTVEINRIVVHRGLRIYQGVEFGHAFFMEVSGPAKEPQVFQLQLQHPDTPEQPSYNDFPNLLGDGRLVRAKYLVDPDKKSFDHIHPLLTLRLDDPDKEVGRLPLQTGAAGTIGPYTFRLIAVAPWSRLILVRLTGIPIVFFGFFIICLGGTLYYFAPPHEVSLREAADGATLVCWRATRFAAFYADEPASLKKALECKSADE